MAGDGARYAESRSGATKFALHVIRARKVPPARPLLLRDADQAIEQDVVVQQLAAGAAVHNLAAVHDQAAVRLRERDLELLLDHEDRKGAGIAHARDRRDQLLHHQRRQTLYRFVQQQ